MAGAAALRVPAAEYGGSLLAERMETARSRLEERFLEGGAALLSILDVLNKLIGSLDELTGSFDEETAAATMGELQQAAGRLSGLSDIESSRQARFVEIAGAEHNLGPHVDEMQETLRYLRTFAVTAKITGAGIPDFAGFAEEILERIQDGTRQVNDFAGKLQHLGSGLGTVMAKGEKIIRRYEATIPAIVGKLATGGADITAQRKVLVERAERVRRIASGIQGKLASTLSAMQIGDITRQRIEHCQATLAILQDFLSGEAMGLDPAQQDGIASVIANLVAMQLRQTIEDFERDTAKIVDTVASFRSDLAEIDHLRQAMTGGEDGGDNAMRRLEATVGDAREAVRDIEVVAAEAGDLSRATAATVRDLVAGIGVVQLVRTDIHYMALNTNLRCGKIGEEGKAINVVTAELRNFAGQLDLTADKVLEELTTLQAAAEKLSAVEDGEAQDTLDSRLATAMDKIRAVGDRMDAQMEALSEQSRVAIGQMDASLSRLNFKAELGEVLRSCADEMPAGVSAVPASDLGPVLADLGGRIARLYTMVSERELHASVFGTAPPVQVAAVAAVMSDDDIEDALF